MKLSSVITLGLAAVFMMTMAGCGLDEYYTSIGEKAVAGQQLYQGGQSSNDQVVECICNCTGGGGTTGFDGTSFVMDSLALGAPLVSFKAIVNDFIKAEVDKGTINVLMSVQDDDRDTGMMVIRFGVGDKAGSSYSLHEGFADVEANLNASSGEFIFIDGVKRFVLVVPMEDSDPISIPIQNVILTGKIDGSKITDGTLTGVVSMEDAEATVVAGFQLSSVLLDAEQAQPDYDMDDDGKNDAWVFTGKFTATTATVEGDDEPVAEDDVIEPDAYEYDVIE